MSVLEQVPRFRAGRLEIRPAERTALIDGRPLNLTVREIEILALLAARPDRIMPREEVFETIWGRPLAPGERMVDVYVSRVRNKLASALPNTEVIQTHAGIGYHFCYEG
jgi:DNA-binding response OmpR family regulator